MTQTTGSPIFTFGGFFKIIRPNNLLMVAFVQLMTAQFLVGQTPVGLPVLQDVNLYLLVISTVILTASGYMINDYYDVKIDYVNRPHEVVVGRGVKRRMVMTLHTFMNFVGIAIGAWVSPRVGVVTFLAAFLLWLYSNSLKRLPFIGNVTVAGLTALSVWIVGYYYQRAEPIIFAYAVFAFFINLMREIIKDIEDKNGDRKHGCRTLPIVLGFRQTKNVIFAIALIFVILLLFVTFRVGDPGLFIYFGFLGIFFAFFLFRIYHADRKVHFSRLSQYAKLLMLIGALSMVFI
jgi:4-hydroxybenzoate polyprenyltransferase